MVSGAPSNSDRLVWLINTEHSRLQRQLRVQLTFLFSVRVSGKAASAAGTERPSSPAVCLTWCVCTHTSSRRSRCFSCCSTPKVGWPGESHLCTDGVSVMAPCLSFLSMGICLLTPAQPPCSEFRGTGRPRRPASVTH